MNEGDDDYAVALNLQQQFDLEYEQSLTSTSTKHTSSVPSIPSSSISSSSTTSHHHEIDDFNLALQLQELENGENDVVFCGEVGDKSKSKTKGNLADKSWELVDPTPDVLSLFVEFNNKFFWGKLASVEVIWSTRMTLCAGVCEYEGKRSGFCCIKLSEPLLKLRPRKDLLETLLHEMIHAYLFLTDNNRDRDGHGPEFQKHMYRLNKETGLNITIYHSFHDEVALYQQHWWRCDGPCRSRAPYYGYVKRAMNRPPSARDTWWAQHQSTCGGKFTKIKEPEKTDSKNIKKNVGAKNDISNMLTNPAKVISKNPTSAISQTPKLDKNISSLSDNNNKLTDDKDNLYKSASEDKLNDMDKDLSNTYFTGTGYKLGSSIPLSSASKVLRDLHEERLANRGNVLKDGNVTNSKIDKGTNNIFLSNEKKSNSTENSHSQIPKPQANQKITNDKNNTTIDSFFTSKSNALNNNSSNSLKKSPIIMAKSNDVKSILSNANLRIGEVVRIPKFVSVSNHKHYKNKYESFFKASNNNDSHNNNDVGDLKRKSDNDDEDLPRKKFTKLEMEEENNTANHRPDKNTINKDVVTGNVNKITISDDDDDDEMCAFASKCEEVYSQAKGEPNFVSDLIKDESFIESPELTRNFSASLSPRQLFPPSPPPSTLKKNCSTEFQQISAERCAPNSAPIDPAPKKRSKKLSTPCLKETLSLLKANEDTPLKKISPVLRSPSSPTCHSPLAPHHSAPPYFNSFIRTHSMSKQQPFYYRYNYPSLYPRYWASTLPRYTYRRHAPNNSRFRSFMYPRFSPYISRYPLTCQFGSYRRNMSPQGKLVGSPLIRPRSLMSAPQFCGSDFHSLTSYPMFSSFPNFRSNSRARKFTHHHKTFSASHGSSSRPILYLNLSLPVFWPSPTSSHSSSSCQSSSSASSSPLSSPPSSPSSSSSSSSPSSSPPSSPKQGQGQVFQFPNSSPIKTVSSMEQCMPSPQVLKPEVKSKDDFDGEDLLSTSVSLLRSPNNITVLRVVPCPVCKVEFKIDLINDHIDECLNL